MGPIVILALGSSVFPTLLAGVAILLSRDKPAKLLLAFWLGGLTVSVIAGILIVDAFGEKASSLGASGSTLAPPYSIAAGVAAIGLGTLIGTKRGRGWIDGWRARRSERKPHKDHKSQPWQDRMLGNGSVMLAATAGGILNLPGPFYLIALGDIASGNYGFWSQVGLILMFNVIMLALVELPMIGFIFDPERTDAWVSSFASWLNRNGIRIIALLAMLWGTSLIVKGISDAGSKSKASSSKKAQTDGRATASVLTYSAISRASSS
ncbi:MAG: GAP family protein [Actinomycetes bacterium]